MRMKFELETTQCASCRRPMLKKAKEGLFPFTYDFTQEKQMKSLGVVLESSSRIDDDKICVECEAVGKASITCVLCDTVKPSSKKQESFGDPAEYLCSDCYATVSAKVWDEKTEKLRKAHRWDFE